MAAIFISDEVPQSLEGEHLDDAPRYRDLFLEIVLSLNSIHPTTSQDCKTRQRCCALLRESLLHIKKSLYSEDQDQDDPVPIFGIGN